MNYLIDTNIISETIKIKPNEHVIAWLSDIHYENLFLSVLTLGEIRKGIEQLFDDQKKKQKLIHWLEQALPMWFGKNILIINQAVAEAWGELSARNQKILPAIDGLIAATALVNDLVLVTRNGKDFDIPGLKLLNPFNQSGLERGAK